MQRQEEEKEEESLQAKLLSEQMTPVVQRQAENEEEEELVQPIYRGGKEVFPTQKTSIRQMQQTGNCGTITDFNVNQILAALGPGRSLPLMVRQEMESIFNADFSQVRVHTDPVAGCLAEQIRARAFTIKRHIGFNRGEFQQDFSSGNRLLKHELAHTIETYGNDNSIHGWFTKDKKEEYRKYLLKGVPEKIAKEGTNHEDMTEAVIKNINSKQKKYGSGAQKIIVYWSAALDDWKGKELEVLATKKEGFPQLKKVGSVRATVIRDKQGRIVRDKVGKPKIEPSPAEKLLHAHGGQKPAQIGIQTRKGGKGGQLTGKGAIGTLLNVATQHFKKGHLAHGLRLLGISLHTIQDFYSHNVPLVEAGEDLRKLKYGSNLSFKELKKLQEREKSKPEGRRIKYTGPIYVLEDDKKLAKWRWDEAKKRTQEQLEHFYRKLTNKRKNDLRTML